LSYGTIFVLSIPFQQAGSIKLSYMTSIGFSRSKNKNK